MTVSLNSTKLQQRGIETAAQRLSWRNGRDGWEFSVMDPTGCTIGRRWKAFDSNAEKKYRWIQRLPGDSSNGFYHVGAGLIDAIAAADGLLHFVNGEPAVLTMLAAGIDNAVCVFGEGNYPDGIAETLKSWHVAKVVYYADKDAKGNSSAGKLAGLLAGSGIQIECRAMLDTMADKSDVNDLWQSVGFNADAFKLALSALPIFTPIIQRESKPLESIKATRTNSGDKWSEFVDSEVLPALDRVGIRQGKKHGLCINPAHDDHHPSARISERGVYVCTCGHFGMKTVAGWLELDFKAWVQAKYPEASKPRQNSAKPTTQPASNILTFEPELPNTVKLPRNRITSHAWGIGNWEHGLPKTVVTAFRKYGPNGSATVAHILNEAVNKDLIDPQCFTRAELFEASEMLGHQIPRKTFNAFMKELEDEEQITGKPVLISVLGSLSINTNGLRKIKINYPQRGRPDKTYRLLPPEDQRQALLDYGHYRLWEKHHPTEDTGGRLAVISTTHQSMIDALNTTENQNDLALELATEIDAIAQGQGKHLTEANAKFRQEMNAFTQSLDDDTVLELPAGAAWVITNVSDHIVAFAHAYAKTIEGEQFTLEQWCNVLGISESSVPKYLKRAGVQRIDMPNRQVLDIKTAESIVNDVEAKAIRVKGCPLFMTAHNKAGMQTRKVPYKSDSAARIAGEWVKQGYSVQVVLQVANAYEVVSQEPIEIQPAETAQKPIFTPDSTPRDADFEVVRPFRERRFNPLWVAGQFSLVLEKQGRKVGKWRFIDQFGEIVETKEPRELAELIINRHIASNQTRRAIQSEMAAGGWRKVSA